MPHIFDEFTEVQEYTINLRQGTSSELAFVSISEEFGQAVVEINSEGIPVGDYELELESYDALSAIQPTLKTDTILISIKQPKTLETQSISAVEPTSWVLGLDLEQESQVEIEVSPDLAAFVSFDQLT